MLLQSHQSSRYVRKLPTALQACYLEVDPCTWPVFMTGHRGLGYQHK